MLRSVYAEQSSLTSTPDKEEEHAGLPNSASECVQNRARAYSDSMIEVANIRLVRESTH